MRPKRVPSAAGIGGTTWKVPVASKATRLDKIPVNAGARQDWDTYKLAWSFQTVDLDGPHGWSRLQSTRFEDVINKLRSFEQRTWAEILRGSKKQNHSVSTSKVVQAARKRLIDLDLDDWDVLVSLHLSGLERVWVIRAQHVACLLWWDPEHQVCPSLKKNT